MTQDTSWAPGGAAGRCRAASYQVVSGLDARMSHRPGSVSVMTAQPDRDLDSYEVIHLGGEAAAIVPLSDLRRLQAVRRHASAELLEEAEVEATLAAHRDWVAAGRPGAVSHEVAMAELLGDQ
jgi:hypothetical protein